MFNVGGMELLVIALVALIVLGPDKLPGAIRQVGNVVGELRRMSSGFQTDLRGALAEAERDAEVASRAANEAGPGSAALDPGAARAAAEIELGAAEAALEAAEDGSTVPASGTEGTAEQTPAPSDDESQTTDAT